MGNMPFSSNHMLHPWLKFYDPHVQSELKYPRVPLYALLEETTAKYPDRPCARFFGKQFSYRKINDWADRFATALRGLGIQPGDRVVLLLPNSPQFLIAYFGI